MSPGSPPAQGSSADARRPILCHPVRDIPIGKNGTVDTNYFIMPKTNETVYASGQVDFDGIWVGTQIDRFETYKNLLSGVYSDVIAGLWWLKHEKPMVNTPAMSKCITRHD
ncbi:MAG: hypothetical protein WBP64_14880 [Nitrososphaeraceae archaeon]